MRGGDVHLVRMSSDVFHRSIFVGAGRKRRRADESTESRSSVSPTLEEYAFSNNNLLQVIVGKDCRIVESNKSFREHFHPKDVDVGDSILRLFSVTNHPILKQYVSLSALYLVSLC